MDALKLTKGKTNSSGSMSGNAVGAATTAAAAATATTATATTAAAAAAPTPQSTLITATSTAAAATAATTTSKSSHTPITVRFNAGEESLDDILLSFHKNATSTTTTTAAAAATSNVTAATGNSSSSSGNTTTGNANNSNGNNINSNNNNNNTNTNTNTNSNSNGSSCENIIGAVGNAIVATAPPASSTCAAEATVTVNVPSASGRGASSNNLSALSGGSGGAGPGGGGGGLVCAGSYAVNVAVGGTDSLSSSPSHQHQIQLLQQQQQQLQQHQQQLYANDEVNMRNNFLQSGFFNRKRSGSIEGVSPTTSGPNLIAALASGSAATGAAVDIGSVGTWKLIKGKVSQTIEEIKSSKSHSSIPIVLAKAPGEHMTSTPTTTTTTTHEPDSDQENITMNTSISEEWPLDAADAKSRGSNAAISGNNSDSDFENEIPLDTTTTTGGSGGSVASLASNTNVPALDVGERSRLRRGLAHIKSKVKSKSIAQCAPNVSTLTPVASKPGRKDLSPTSTAHTAMRGNFLRKRHRKHEVDAAELATPSNPPTSIAAPDVHVLSGKTKQQQQQHGSIINAKRDLEIESGVEMLEDMLPAVDLTMMPDAPSMAANYNAKRSSMDLKLEGLGRLGSQFIRSAQSGTSKRASPSDSTTLDNSSFNLHTDMSITSLLNSRMFNADVAMQYLPLTFMLLFMGLTLMPFPDFMRGIFATLFGIAVVESSGTYFHRAVEHFAAKNPPEKTTFKVPDYSKMPICEIPAAEEHKTIKIYAGWLNELNSYDPNTFSFSMTRSVYVRLDGSVLKLSGTNARIPKRVMWNEQPIDRSRIIFTDHRTYNLAGCRIELLPLGLAKKRYFNRKYPIQLIINLNCDDVSATSPIPAEDQPKQEAKETKTNPSTHSSEPSTAAEEQSVRQEKQIDFAATVLNADLKKLQSFVNVESEQPKELTMPCGDEVRLLLFTRSDREKEDWYRRFVAASKGNIHDQDLRLPKVKFVEEADLQAAATKAALVLTNANPKPQTQTRNSKDSEERLSMISEDSQGADVKHDKSTTINAEDETNTTPDMQFEDLAMDEDILEAQNPDDTYQGLLMSTCAARNPPDYIRFMAKYQGACSESKIPVYKRQSTQTYHRHQHRRKQRRAQRQEEELWKGIDQSLFLGPSGSVVWANVVFGRCMYSCLHDKALQAKIQDFLQKKLNSIKLPNFMESVNITQIHMGETPMLIHRVSQPMLDERGTWLDADITYEGLAHITVTTKLNLLRMKRPKQPIIVQEQTTPTPVIPETLAGNLTNNVSDEVLIEPAHSAIYDSDAESSGSSSTDTESPPPGGAVEGGTTPNDFFQNSPGNARRIFKIVDRIATSNFFQYATELPYVQRAMENMSANITLRVDLKGLVARGTLNMPPPPSDRIWMCFRGPPRLWIRAKPTVGDKSVDWSIVTNVIESKLCEAVNKYLVYPNMVDFTIPFLGKPTCEEFAPSSN